MSTNANVASDADETLTVDALMTRYPGPVSIHPDGSKLGVLMIIALAFVTLSVWGTIHSASLGNNVKSVVLAICGAYFGWQAVGLARLLSGTPLLTLRSDGLFVTNGFRRWDFSWNEVGESFVMRYTYWRFVGIPCKKKPDEKPPFSSSIRLPRVQPMKVQELVLLINRWRAAALTHAAKGDVNT